MTLPRTVLVLGARGRFGRAVAQAFARAGWQVVAHMRQGATPPAFAGVHWVAAAPGDTAALVAAAQGASVVVQGLSPVYTHKAWRAEVPRLTQAAIDVTRALGATLLLPASVYNYGHTMPPRLHEDTPQAATTLKGLLRKASEQQIEAATRDGRMKAVVIRAGDFFGSGTGSWFDKVMVKRIAKGRFTYPGQWDVPTTWAYLPDMARSFVAVAERAAANPGDLPAFETFHFAGHQLTGRAWADALTVVAREQGWLPPGGALRLHTVPWPLVRMLGWVVPMAEALSEMRYLWRTPYALVNTRMAALVGPEPHTPFPQALREALAEQGLVARTGPHNPAAVSVATPSFQTR